MIVADKNLLRATLTRGMITLQQKLIDLYINNLNSLSISGALVAGFAYTGISEIVYSDTGNSSIVVEFVYFIAVTFAITCGLFLVSQTTIIVVYAAAKALKANSGDIVLEVVKNIQNQQVIIFKTGVVLITSIFIHCIAMIWAKATTSVSIAITILYVLCYIFICAVTNHFYHAFHPEQKKIQDVDIDAGDSSEDPRGSISGYPRSYSKLKSSDSVSSNVSEVSSSLNPATLKAANLKAQGFIFWRNSLSKGGSFREVFATLNKGMLDFYNAEVDFLNNENPLNAKTIKLSNYNIETDYRKFVMAGVSDFSFAETLTSPYDLKTASAKFKFSLLPKVSTELNAVPIVELLCADEESYKLWTQTLSKVIKAQDELNKGTRGAVSVTQPLTKIASVENAVEAAINSRVV